MTTLKDQPRANQKKARALYSRLRRHGLGDPFKGLREDAIIRAIKRTRAAIWQEKLAARP